jgi:hypothetical protein
VPIGSKVVLGLRLPDIIDTETVTWSDGSHGATLTVNPLSDATYTATYQVDGTTYSQSFALTVYFTETIEGTRYLRNVATGQFLTAGNRVGTQGTLGDTGVDFVLTANGTGYTLDSGINNGGANQFFGPDLFLDNASTTWTIAPSGTSDGKTTYTLTVDGVNFLAAPESGNIVVTTATATDERAQWMLYSREEMLSRMAQATTSNPIDATFLLPGYNFGRNDTRNAKWQGAPAISGDETNLNAEKFNTDFDVYQELTDLPSGLYAFSVQGFYRYGGHGTEPAASARAAGSESINAYLYASSEQAPMPSIFDAAGKCGTIGSASTYGYVPNNQSEASAYMSAGLYWSQPVRVWVPDGTLRLGIRKSTTVTNDWTLFDNFRLLYLGPHIPGDVNADGQLTTDDIWAMTAILLGQDNSEPHLYNHTAADLDGNGSVTLADLTSLVNLVRGMGN